MLLIVSMGIPDKKFNKLNEGFRFRGAVIQVIDWDKKSVINETTYISPPEHLGDGLSMQFKGASIDGDKYYVVTNTEVLIYRLTDWKLEKALSHPTFNDLHGVLPAKDKLYVCNTGLEIVQAIDDNSEIIEEICLTSIPTWKRFDKSQDYRCIATTKPHEMHINHLFVLDGQLWVTRGKKGDTVNAYNPEETFPVINEQNITCHDGIIRGQHIYFTSVNGHIVAVDSKTRTQSMDIDLNTISNLKKRIGWTRGLEVIGNRAFIGTSQLRQTKFEEYTRWLASGEKPPLPSTIFEVDLQKKEIVDTFEMKHSTGAAIYTILQYPV